jgi:uncharacterized membrane protein
VNSFDFDSGCRGGSETVRCLTSIGLLLSCVCKLILLFSVLLYVIRAVHNCDFKLAIN